MPDEPGWTATILGGGATAASTGLALADLGAGALRLLVRDPARAADTVAALRRHPSGPDVEVAAAVRRTGVGPVVVSTIPAAGQTDDLVARCADAAVLFDVVYHPWPTPLAESVLAGRGDDRVLVSGLDLLVHQAALQFELFTGLPADAALVAAMRAALPESLSLSHCREGARLDGSRRGRSVGRVRAWTGRPLDRPRSAPCVGCVGGSRIIERVPEPEPDEEPDGGDTPAEHTERADDRHRAESMDAPTVGPAETMPVRAAEQAPAAQPTAARRVGPGKEPAEEPKELYFAIADTPGLLWRCIVAGAIAGGLIGLAVGWDWSLLFLLPLVPVSLALTVIDWRTKLLPTWLIARTYVGLVVLVLVCALITQDWHDLVRAAHRLGRCGAAVLRALVHPPARARLRRRAALRDHRPRARLRRLRRSWWSASTPGSCSAAWWRAAVDAADRAPQGLPLRSVHVRRRDRRAACR